MKNYSKWETGRGAGEDGPGSLNLTFLSSPTHDLAAPALLEM